MSTSGRVYDDFVRLFFLYTHREASILVGELPEESDQFRFLRAARLANLKGSLGLILAKLCGLRNEGYYSYRILSLASLTLVEHLFFLLLLVLFTQQSV